MLKQSPESRTASSPPATWSKRRAASNYGIRQRVSSGFAEVTVTCCRSTLPKWSDISTVKVSQGQHFIHPGDIVLDCGASDGDFTRESLKAGAKLVVAIEVSPTSVECIRRNLVAEAASGRVIVYAKGVWDHDDALTLHVDNSNFAANSVVMHSLAAHAAGTVPLTTIDRIVEELRLPRVDFIKMDVEGAEVRAIGDANETLTRFKPRLAIATEHTPEDERTIPAKVHEVRADYQDRMRPLPGGEGACKT